MNYVSLKLLLLYVRSEVVGATIYNAIFLPAKWGLLVNKASNFLNFGDRK